MNAKWMLGTALATIVVAAPALAQDEPDQTAFGNCALSNMTNDQFMGFDENGDAGLSLDEYRTCLSDNNIDLNDQQSSAFETAYNGADANGDGVLMFPEVETYVADNGGSGNAQSASAEGKDGAPKGTITVTQPAAQVTVDQGAAQVAVQQKEPTVDVETKKPTVDVTTPEPQVDVSQAQPTVDVQQPEPQVSVQQPEPTVDVSQPEPQVAVTPGQPSVEVEAQAPEVAVETPRPEVDVQQPELAVDVQQEDPSVAVDQASPDVDVSQTPEMEAEPETPASPDPAVDVQSESETAASSMEADATQMAAAEPADTRVYQVRIDDLEGEDVISSAGDDIGEIETILLDPSTNAPVVIVSMGGVLGIGAKEVAFPYDDFTISDDDVVLNTDLSEDQIDDMDAYDEADYEDLPETMIAR